jgi:hypothetical protein
VGSVYRMKGRITWMLKYYRDGKAIYESAKTANKREAARRLKQRERSPEKERRTT